MITGPLNDIVKSNRKVVDLRDNPGGNSRIFAPLLKYHVLLKDRDPETLEPDIKVDFTFSDFEHGTDPSLEAVLNYKSE